MPPFSLYINKATFSWKISKQLGIDKSGTRMSLCVQGLERARKTNDVEARCPCCQSFLPGEGRIMTTTCRGKVRSGSSISKT